MKITKLSYGRSIQTGVDWKREGTGKVWLGLGADLEEGEDPTDALDALKAEVITRLKAERDECHGIRAFYTNKCRVCQTAVDEDLDLCEDCAEDEYIKEERTKHTPKEPQT